MAEPVIRGPVKGLWAAKSAESYVGLPVVWVYPTG